MSNIGIDNRAADNLRVLSLSMVEKSRSGHPGGAMGAALFIHILYSDFLCFDPGDPHWRSRDRFFLDPGHMSPMLYAILALCGKYSMADLKAFRQLGSPTPGHPEKDVARGVENTSGPLGQGHVMAVGAAIAERFLVARFGETHAHKTVAFISDGGIQEEISQGGGRLAGHLGLHNLIMFYDANQVQLSTRVNEVTSEDTALKYRAWGWNVITINGNSPEEIRGALARAWAETKAPTLIIGNTTMGRGIRNANGEPMEGLVSTHGQPISHAGADVAQTILGLGGNTEDPFMVFEDVSRHYQSRMEAKRLQAGKLKQKQFEWAGKNPAKAKRLDSYYNKKLPEIAWNEIALKPDVATRASSAEILAYFSKTIGNMLVMSADLANSDRTDGFLTHSSPIRKNDFAGGFLHVGVSELTMAALANGMALHGGLIPVCGTFFVFSDYMKPALRMSALMELQVIYIWSHDAFRVGEDGPTHQPVEQEAQIRLMEQLKNHSGKRSFIALRPADQAETLYAWMVALDNINRPTGLILSRQNIKTLPSTGSLERRYQAAHTVNGAYFVGETIETPDIYLVASGSEVSLLIETAAMLKSLHNISAQVVSAPSEGLFREQPQEYRMKVIPRGKKVFGVTAGLPSTLQQLTGSYGRVFGLDHFGYSASAAVLDKHFGYTPENIARLIIVYLHDENNFK